MDYSDELSATSVYSVAMNIFLSIMFKLKSANRYSVKLHKNVCYHSAKLKSCQKKQEWL